VIVKQIGLISGRQLCEKSCDDSNDHYLIIGICPIPNTVDKREYPQKQKYCGISAQFEQQFML
jgi:hypothetical protein